MNKLLRVLVIFFLILAGSQLAKAQNCTVNAGINTTICPGTPFVLTGAVSGSPVPGTASWSQVSGPSVTLSASTVVGQTVTATVTGYVTDVEYTFRISSKCTDGSLVTQDVKYTASSLGTANAGPDAYACVGTYVLQGSPLGPGETGVWTRVSPTGPAPNAGSANLPNGTITFSAQPTTQATTYRWTVSKTTGGNTCVSFDDVVITNLGTQSVSAGNNIDRSCYNVTTSAQLSGSYAGTNAQYGQSAKWTFVSGPSTPTISNSAIYNPTVGNLVEGTYVFRYTVTGPCFSGSDEVSVIVAGASQDITNAGNATLNYCDGRTSVLLTAPKALYAGETVQWSTNSGAGTPVFSDPTSNITTVSGLSGTSNYSFNYKIKNTATGCESNGTYNVNFRTPPSISITTPGPLFVTCGQNSATVNYTASNGAKIEYALISAPANSTREIMMGGLNNWTDAASGVLTNFDKIGTYVLRYRASYQGGVGGCADAYAEISIVVSASPTAANAGTKQVLNCNVFATALQGNVPSVGTGSWSQISGPNQAVIVNPLVANSAVNSMTNGTYVFRWTISGGEGGCPNTQSDVQVVVSAPSPTTSVAGNPQAVCNATPVTLQGNTPVLNETGTWTVRRTVGNLPAPEVTFAPNINTPAAVANGLLASTAYTFTWTITNACGSSSSDVSIVTSNTAGPKQATASIAGGVTCLAGGTTSFTLAGNQPSNGETGLWTLLPGAPNTPTFTAGQYNTPVTGAVNGTYRFEWQLNNNSCAPTRDTVTITISAAATTANAGTDKNVCGSSTTLTANNPSVGVGMWTQVGGAGGAVIDNPASATINLTGLTDGRYTFRWTITNSACSSNFDEVVVNVSTGSTVPNAGPDQAVCAVNSTTLAANTITQGTGSWVAVSGPTIPAFANVNSPTTSVSNLAYGVYVLRWVSRGGIFCPVLTDDVTIAVTQNANAGADQSLCAASSINLAGNENSTGTWTNLTGPNTPTLTAVGTNGVVVSGLVAGTYTFNYHLNAVGLCPATDDQVQVTIVAAPSPADAGADKSICLPLAAPNSTAVAMTGTVPVSGTGTWTLLDQTSGAPTPVIATPGSATSNITGLGVNTTTGVGVYLFEWKVAGTGPCASNENTNRDIVRVTIYREPQAAAAGPDQTSACSNNVIMAATPITYGVGTWTVSSQPGGSPAVVFDAVNSPTTKISGLVAGNYTFTWTVTNGSPTCTPKTDDVNVTVTTTTITTADAGTAQSVCNTLFPATASAMLAGNEPLASETGTWTIISQPAGSAATFANANLYNTTINGLQAATNLAVGTYTLRWTIKNTANQTPADCSSASDVVITVYNPPSAAAAGPDQQVCLFAPVTLAATAVSPERGTGTWSVQTKPVGATDPVFANVNSPTSSVNGLIAGNYTFRWTVSNGSPTCTSTTDDVNILISNCEIAVAKSTSTPAQQADGSYNITLTFKVRNTGNTALSGVQVTDNLVSTFPSPKIYTKISLSTPGGSTLAVNTSFNGNTDQNLLNPATSSLAPSAEETITLVVNVKLN